MLGKAIKRFAQTEKIEEAAAGKLSVFCSLTPEPTSRSLLFYFWWHGNSRQFSWRLMIIPGAREDLERSVTV
jgi:hypothetical protein